MAKKKEVWEKAFNDYFHKGFTQKEICARYGVGMGTIKKWTATYWKELKEDVVANTPYEELSDDAKKRLNRGEYNTVYQRAKRREKVHSEVKKVKGNPNPKNQFQPGNTAGTKHGMFKKFLHPEQLEVIEAMQDMSMADIVWSQIEFTYGAIIRAQKIFLVESENHDKLVVQAESEQGISYAVSMAHDRYESFMRTINKATAELRNQMRHFLEVATEDDERRLKIEMMQATLTNSKTTNELNKAKLEAIQGGKADTSLMAALLDAVKPEEIK